jgi:hypothetical protein
MFVYRKPLERAYGGLSSDQSYQLYSTQKTAQCADLLSYAKNSGQYAEVF